MVPMIMLITLLLVFSMQQFDFSSTIHTTFIFHSVAANLLFFVCLDLLSDSTLIACDQFIITLISLMYLDITRFSSVCVRLNSSVSSMLVLASLAKNHPQSQPLATGSSLSSRYVFWYSISLSSLV